MENQNAAIEKKPKSSKAYQEFQNIETLMLKIFHDFGWNDEEMEKVKK